MIAVQIPTDEQWALVQPFLPLPSSGSRGRPPTDPRAVLAAVFWKLRRRAPWYDLPENYPPWPTCYRYYHGWLRDGILDQIGATLYRDLLDRGSLDRSPVDREEFFRNEVIMNLMSFIRQPCDRDGESRWQPATARLLLALVVLQVKQRLTPPQL
jgi:transposase